MKLLIVSMVFMLTPLHLFSFCFEDAGSEYGIDSRLLENIARVESNLNPRAINLNSNGSSDIGLMQINSFWIKAF